MAETRNIAVEVVYALPDRQRLLRLTVPYGTSVRQAVAASGIAREFPEIDVLHCPLGVFGKAVAAPEQRVLEEGERVEIYRPLIADPKEVRKQRAARAKAARAER